jgi:hypothetical protein
MSYSPRTEGEGFQTLSRKIPFDFTGFSSGAAKRGHERLFRSGSGDGPVRASRNGPPSISDLLHRNWEQGVRDAQPDQAQGRGAKNAVFICTGCSNSEPAGSIGLSLLRPACHTDSIQFVIKMELHHSYHSFPGFRLFLLLPALVSSYFTTD